MLDMYKKTTKKGKLFDAFADISTIEDVNSSVLAQLNHLNQMDRVSKGFIC